MNDNKPENANKSINNELDKKSDIEIFGLSGILQGIAENRRSGALFAHSANEEKYVSFSEGQITMVASPNRPSVLAEGVRRAFHQINDEVMDALFTAQGATGKRLSTILLEMEAEEKFIVDLCKFQIHEEIWELFTWKNIKFEFLETPPENLFPEELTSLSISLDLEVLLIETAQRLDEWKTISEVFPSFKDVPYIAQDIYEEQLSEEEIHVLSTIDGGWDFEEIINNCRLPQFQCWQILYKMHQEGNIALRSAQELKEMADFDVFREDIFKCIKLYERAEELGNKEIDTISWLAEAYEVCEQIAKAVKKYKELGVIFIEKEELEGAIEAYNQVITYSPDDLEAHEKYVEVLFQNGSFQEGASACIIYAKKVAVEDKRKAIQVLEEAYQYNPLNPEVLEHMATFYSELGDHIDAIFTYTTLANLYKSRSLYDDAIRAYKKILSLDRSNIESRIELGNTYMLMDRREEGVLEFKKLGDILAGSDYISQPFAFNYLINVCQKIIEYEPGNLGAREWLADIYLHHKKYDKAGEVLIDLLDILEQQKRGESLVSVLQKLVQIDPKNRDFHRKLAETYHGLERFEEATEELIKLSNLAIESGSLYAQSNDDVSSTNAMMESLDALDAVLLMEPFNLEVRQKRAELMQEFNYKEDAIEEYKLICHMTKAINNFSDALMALFQIVELAPKEEPAAFLDIARLCEKQKKNDLAIKFYKKFARFCMEKGNLGDVLLACKKLLILAPNDEEAKHWRHIAIEIIGP